MLELDRVGQGTEKLAIEGRVGDTIPVAYVRGFELYVQPDPLYRFVRAQKILEDDE